MNLDELTKLYDFPDKTAIITGGSGALGSEMAIALAELGANVAILDRVTDLSPTAQARLEKSSATAGPWPAICLTGT